MASLKSVLSTFFESDAAKYMLLFVYGAAWFAISVAFTQCSVERAQQRVQDAVGRAEAAEATVYMLKEENARLRETMARANDAVERALNLVLEAQDRHEQRIETIESDPNAADWLACELPAGVREAFADYYRD